MRVPFDVNEMVDEFLIWQQEMVSIEIGSASVLRTAIRAWKLTPEQTSLFLDELARRGIV